ncbi:glycoside hydrolase family 97 protein [Thalassotalea sp. 1_MG-2023]|uniref:glycoside hydrolase family 97 protein n=1 Tax=Thalassotalea sp. 1_MG-2023 TaxID=3062680 RepID=UPI0026E35A4A|nr:glycoside hydrolase family 97 protein [Thalassotalea sp. 1_MG-2023]MDO6427131.1 glycoside hydrolase family 97 protein [Thalassotalea sp. 1_MG-2023]
MKKNLLVLTTLFASTYLNAPNLIAKTVKVSSPNNKITVSVSDENTPSYRVSFNGNQVIDTSLLGLRFQQSADLAEGFTISSSKQQTADSTWQLPWGERKNVRDNHHELIVNFTTNRDKSNQFSVRFRVFNDGIGFRYEVPKQPGLDGNIAIVDELTEFNVPNAEKTTAWWIPARGWNRYEYIYQTTPLSEIDLVHTPLTMKLASGEHISIHEAALVDYAGMTILKGRHNKLKADLTPWYDGVLVRKTPDFTSPWRTIQISKNAAGLLNSDLILNLNEPSKLTDTSWIEPGKYVGIWWGMHVGETTWGSGKKHGATTEETKRYMDFAAKYGFDGVLVEGWNIGWDGDWYDNGDVFNFTQSYDDFNLKAVTDHGLAKGVRLVGHHETSGNVTNYRNQMADAFELYQQHGVRQVKTGYVADGGKIKRVDEHGIARFEWHDGQFMVNEYLDNVTLAAKYKISINTHEPIKDTGLRRTYPNWISREGARGQEYNAWGSPPNPPSHTAILPFTRMLAGPMDFTPGTFNMAYKGLGADTDRPQTTLAKQLALYVVIFSPIQMASDLPRNYEANLPAFQFIRDVPTDWQESKALDGEIGEYVVMARQERLGQDWYLGALTNEDARKITVSLDFLSPDKRYQAQIYRDGEKANWIDNPYEIIIENKPVSANDSLTLSLATSGGTAIRFKALD